MKSIVLTKYGSPDFLEIKDIKTPVPQNNEVLVRIKSASVNLTDLEIVRGDAIVRLSTGIRKPKNPRLGCDFAGEVESVGKHVNLFKEGDAVNADLMYQKKAYGAFAEYVCVPEQRLRFKPESMSFEEASTIPQAGCLALQGISGKIPLKKEDKVLINGAGGGVGSFAIQIAKYYETEVTAVDSGEKFEFMKSLGADHVIDYTKQDYSKGKEKYDLIRDVIATKSLRAYRRALKPGGSYRMVGGSLPQIFGIGFAMLFSRFSNKKIGLMIGNPNKKEDMEKLADLYDQKKVIPVIDKVFKLEKVPEAISYLSKGRSKGKVVISIA